MMLYILVLYDASYFARVNSALILSYYHGFLHNCFKNRNQLVSISAHVMAEGIMVQFQISNEAFRGK